MIYRGTLISLTGRHVVLTAYVNKLTGERRRSVASGTFSLAVSLSPRILIHRRPAFSFPPAILKAREALAAAETPPAVASLCILPRAAAR